MEPGARSRHTAVYDSDDGTMVICGGTNDSPPNFDDTWELSLSGTPAWTQRSSLGITGAVVDHVAIYDSPGHRMLIFGDVDPFSNGSELFELPLGGAGAWHQLSVPGGPPGARRNQIGALDPATRRMFVYGGLGAPVLSDTWALSIGTPAWAPVTLDGRNG